MLKLNLASAFLKKSFKILAIATAVIAVTGFLIIPAVLRPVLEKKMTEALHRQVAVRSVAINPFILSFALKGVTINQRDSSEVMVSFDEFYVNIQAMSVVKRGLIVSSVRLVKPYVYVARNADLTYNFTDLLVPGTAPPREEKPKEPFRFSINNIEVKDGSADFLDAPRNTRHTVRDVNLSVPFLSNLPYDLSSYVEPFFKATVNNTAIVFKGKTLPFEESLETTLDIDLKDINLAHYMAYSPVPLRFKVLSGSLDVQATVSFKQFKDRSPVISLKGTVAVKDIKLADTQRKALVEFKRFSVTFLPSDLMAREVHLADISLQSPKLTVDRDREGKLGIVAAFVLEKAKGEEKADSALAEAAPNGEKPEAAAAPPIIDIDALTIRDGTVLFTDWTPVLAPEVAEDEGKEPVRIAIEKISLKGSALSTRKDKKGDLELSLNINKKGFIRTSGTLGINPFAFETRVDIGELGLSAFQPYIAQNVHINLNDGRFFLQGDVRVLAGEGKEPFVFYRGSASVTRLAVRDSRNNDDLLTWRSLRFDGIDAGSNPLRVRIGTIALSDFFAGIVVAEDGTVNLARIAKKAPAADEKNGEEKKQEPAPLADTAQAPVAQGPAPDIAIGQVTLTNGSVSFIDNHVKPRYAANIVEIHGKVTGLSSNEDLLADIMLAGSFDQYAPLTIAGKINPLRNDLFVDVKADFKGLELSTLTPYSGTYIGKAVEKGKFSLGIQYHIVKKKLDAKNNIFIDQLTLGEKIESSKATSLPVGLAISLLKDRNGEIRLDIPVTGETDNPEFRVWKVVWQVLGNLVVKAATSPFALLGSMMGGGEELGYVEFDYGAAELNEPGRKKMETLVKALYERPALKLEIAGYVGPAGDSEALRASRMKSMIVAEKMKDLTRKDDRTALPDSVQISAAEYPVYLKKVYKNGKFAKPRNVVGIAKDLPDGEMEQLLLASIKINDDDLRQLASLRARTVKDALLRYQKVEPERIFLIEPKSLQPEPKEKIKNSRVDFSLK